MSVLSIVLVFLFLGTLVILGAVLAGFGVRRLQRQVHGGDVNSSRALLVSLDIVMAAFGLLLAFYGILGVFRLVWGS